MNTKTHQSISAVDTGHPPLAYRPDIDGLRAVAILGVVAYHAGIWGLSGGYLGVDVFFVISGYLITQLLYHQILATGRISLTDFYARRARRLLPSLLIVTLFTVVAGYWLLPPLERVELTKSALASLGFAANLFFLSNTGGYFDGPSDLKPLLHLWSLAVEEQFYLIWPLLLMAIHALVPPKLRLKGTQLTIAMIIIGSLSLGIWLQNSGKPSAAFFVAPSRAWELGIGALIALWRPPRIRLSVACAQVMSWLGVLMICTAYLTTSEHIGIQPLAMLLCVAGTAMVIVGGGAAPESAVPKLLSRASLVTIGKLSYSWYLWHWPLLSLLLNVTEKQTTIWLNSSCMLMALVFAALTVKYIENPIRFGTRSRPPTSARDLKLGGAALFAVSVVVAGVLVAQSFARRTSREQVVVSIAADFPRQFTSDCLIEREAWNGVLPDQCRYGPRSLPLALAVYGDSHAAHWIPMVETLLAQKDHATFGQFTMSGCQPLSPGVLKISSKIAVCNSYEKQAMARILALRASGLKGVILAGRWSQPRHMSWSRFPSSTPHLTFEEAVDSASQVWRTAPASHAAPALHFLRDGLTPILNELQSAGLKVLILLDAPEFKYPVPLCVYYDSNVREHCGVSRAEYERAFGEDRAAIKAIAASYPSVHVFDPVPDICSAQDCPPFWEGHPVLMDDSHISTSTARALAPFAKADMDWLLD